MMGRGVRKGSEGDKIMMRPYNSWIIILLWEEDGARGALIQYGEYMDERRESGQPTLLTRI